MEYWRELRELRELSWLPEPIRDSRQSETGYETDAIAAAVIGGTSMTGGIGTIPGTLIGILIIGTLNNGLNLLDVSSYWQQIIKGLIILGAVCFDIVSKKVSK